MTPGLVYIQTTLPLSGKMPDHIPNIYNNL